MIPVKIVDFILSLWVGGFVLAFFETGKHAWLAAAVAGFCWYLSNLAR